MAARPFELLLEADVEVAAVEEPAERIDCGRVRVLLRLADRQLSRQREGDRGRQGPQGRHVVSRERAIVLAIGRADDAEDSLAGANRHRHEGIGAIPRAAPEKLVVRPDVGHAHRHARLEHAADDAFARRNPRMFDEQARIPVRAVNLEDLRRSDRRSPCSRRGRRAGARSPTTPGPPCGETRTRARAGERARAWRSGGARSDRRHVRSSSAETARCSRDDGRRRRPIDRRKRQASPTGALPGQPNQRPRACLPEAQSPGRASSHRGERVRAMCGRRSAATRRGSRSTPGAASGRGPRRARRSTWRVSARPATVMRRRSATTRPREGARFTASTP